MSRFNEFNTCFVYSDKRPIWMVGLHLEAPPLFRNIIVSGKDVYKVTSFKFGGKYHRIFTVTCMLCIYNTHTYSFNIILTNYSI